MIFETFPVGMLQCNCVILGDEQTREAMVIDPGDEVERIVAALEKHRLKLRKIVNTHTHIDHVGANAELQELTGAEVLIHKSDLFLLEHLAVQAQMIGMSAPPSSKADAFLEAGDTLECGAIRCGVLHTPGHTPGSLTLDTAIPHKNLSLLRALAAAPSGSGDEAAARQVLFTGDTLFLSSIGRTDLWGGDFETILKSLGTILKKYDDSTLVLPGHGPATTIGRERNTNPFLQDV